MEDLGGLDYHPTQRPPPKWLGTYLKFLTVFTIITFVLSCVAVMLVQVLTRAHTIQRIHKPRSLVQKQRTSFLCV